MMSQRYATTTYLVHIKVNKRWRGLANEQDFHVAESVFENCKRAGDTVKLVAKTGNYREVIAVHEAA